MCRFFRRQVSAVFFGLLLGGDGLAARAVVSEPLLPIPALPAQHQSKVDLGARLFADQRFSRDNSVSCTHCHVLQIGGMDRQPKSFGVAGALGVINTPTVYNSGFDVAQFWDGRARTLTEQVAGPVHNPIEMASDWDSVIAKLTQDPDYPRWFQRLYGNGITAANIQDAIAAFERSLTTPGSRFDRWLQGDADALNEQELAGYVLFKSYGCVACHQGMNVGGNMYQQMGVMRDYFAERGGDISAADLGRFNVTGKEEDKYHFKVPSLRLVVLTAPYFHDASAQTLEQAIGDMARYQLGRDISRQDIAKIIAFLKTLVGHHPRLAP
jgi:cytochrome c peroxidase